MPRLTLVFWLGWFGALVSVVSLFATVPTGDLAWVSTVGAVSFALFFASAGTIGPSGWGGILRPSFLVTPLSFLLLLFLLPSLLGGLSVIGRTLKSWGLRFLRPGLRFFDPWVLHRLALSTGFGRGWSTTL